MPSYRVCFINEIPKTKSFSVAASARSSSDSPAPVKVEAAKKRFARLENIRDWKIHAALIEMEPIHIETKPADATLSKKDPFLAPNENPKAHWLNNSPSVPGHFSVRTPLDQKA